MKTIKLTDQELESMIEMYTAEMEEAKIYISKIQELLKNLVLSLLTKLLLKRSQRKGVVNLL
jgi:hypothetical protein